jgi:hypothetical protein
MQELKVIGLDLAKNVFQIHGIDDRGRKLRGAKLKRGQVLPYLVCAVQRRRFPVGARPTRQPAPAGSNRSNYGGNEMVEASG